MQRNYSQRLEMQIPQENSSARLNQSQFGGINAFLKQNFKFPSQNLKEIKQIINGDSEFKRMIFNLPDEISSELYYNKISLDFMKETDPSEMIIEIVIYSKLDEKLLLEKEDTISDKLIEKYPKTMLEYIILVEPYDR